eukprot:310098-Prymnesium_polylepis.3
MYAAVEPSALRRADSRGDVCGLRPLGCCALPDGRAVLLGHVAVHEKVRPVLRAQRLEGLGPRARQLTWQLPLDHLAARVELDAEIREHLLAATAADVHLRRRHWVQKVLDDRPDHREDARHVDDDKLVRRLGVVPAKDFVDPLDPREKLSVCVGQPHALDVDHDDRLVDLVAEARGVDVHHRALRLALREVVRHELFVCEGRHHLGGVRLADALKIHQVAVLVDADTPRGDEGFELGGARGTEGRVALSQHLLAPLLGAKGQRSNEERAARARPVLAVGEASHEGDQLICR